MKARLRTQGHENETMKNLEKLLALSLPTLMLSFYSASSTAAEALVANANATAGKAAIENTIVEKTVVMSPSSGILKMLLGLAIVLAVMALITWFLKRMMPGVGSKQSLVRIVGAVSVGARERVVVVEVAGRWIVVGVAPGQVTGIANLEIGAEQLAQAAVAEANNAGHVFSHSTEPFALWLNKSMAKILDKKVLDKKNVSQ